MPTLVFEHSSMTGADRLGSALRDYGHQLDIRRLHLGDSVPADLDDVDAIITCGGPQTAEDDALPWLEPQMTLLRAAHEAQLPILGICLGSQILGRALGGTVGKMKGGVELGWHEVTLTPAGCDDPLFRGIGWSTMQPHWHSNEVKDLPPNARLLASSAQCTNQAWGAGLRTYGIQYHPEMTPGRLDEWAADEPDALRDAGVISDDLRARTEQHFPACARLADRLFETIALVVMPNDRRYTGIVKDLHH